MLIKVDWPNAYSAEAKEKWEALNWEKVQANYPLAAKDKPEDAYYADLGTPTRLTEEEMVNLVDLGFKLEVVPYPGAMVTKMKDRHKWEYDEDVHPLNHLKTGKAVQITVADMALLLINEVEVCEDMCTRELQEMLNNGWRILAVCPPNAQRRPDYILGRVKPKDDSR